MPVLGDEEVNLAFFFGSEVAQAEITDALPGDLGRFCGDYGWPHDVMRVYGKDGRILGARLGGVLFPRL